MSRKFTPPEKLSSGATRLTVKRCCNRCGDEVGDATQAELEAAMNGSPLPDVRQECGCWSPLEEHTPGQRVLVEAFGFDEQEGTDDGDE